LLCCNSFAQNMFPQRETIKYKESIEVSNVTRNPNTYSYAIAMTHSSLVRSLLLLRHDVVAGSTSSGVCILKPCTFAIIDMHPHWYQDQWRITRKFSCKGYDIPHISILSCACRNACVLRHIIPSLVAIAVASQVKKSKWSYTKYDLADVILPITYDPTITGKCDGSLTTSYRNVRLGGQDQSLGLRGHLTSTHYRLLLGGMSKNMFTFRHYQ
jgi:hypothetical protein